MDYDRNRSRSHRERSPRDRDRDRDSHRSYRDRSASPRAHSRHDTSAEAKKRDAIAAAAAAAEKINAQLQVKLGGTAPSASTPSSTPAPTPSGPIRATEETMIDEGDFIRDIEINHLRNRYTLTKGQTQAMIKTETGADVTTRGRYYPDPSMATEKEPALYLHITAQSKEALEKAVGLIEDLMKRDNMPPRRDPSAESGTPPAAPSGPSYSNQHGPPAHQPYNQDDRQGQQRFFNDRPRGEYRPRQPWIEAKVPIGIDYIGPGFSVRGNIVGAQGSNVKHIQAETSCRVQIKGRGSQFIEQSTGRESDEPVFLHILGRDQESVDRAVGLAQDLIKTVNEDYLTFKANPRPQQRRYDDGGGYNNNNRGPRDGGRRDDRYGGGGGGYNSGGYGGGGRDDRGAPRQQSPDHAAEAAADSAASQQPDYTAYYAAVAAGQDPYAAYGGYAAYVQYYQQYYEQYYAQQAAAGQAPADAASASAPSSAPPGMPAAGAGAGAPGAPPGAPASFSTPPGVPGTGAPGAPGAPPGTAAYPPPPPGA